MQNTDMTDTLYILANKPDLRVATLDTVEETYLHKDLLEYEDGSFFTSWQTSSYKEAKDMQARAEQAGKTYYIHEI